MAGLARAGCKTMPLTATAEADVTNIKIPPVFKSIFEPCRLKVFYGGRGGGKSETVGRYLLIVGSQEPMKIVCAREFQNSIKDSVYDMLKHLIEEYELEDFYEVLKTEIRGKNGTSFAFVGLHHNISNIKSMYDVKKFWIEEAETVSDSSWQIIFPTIRAENSEIIVTFNPDIEDSPTYQRMVVDPPSYATVKKISYRENTHFPAVLELERAELSGKAKTSKKAAADYDNVWEGNVRAAVAGAIFADEMRKAQQEDRIRDNVPYDKTKPVDVFYDLGRGDKTAMWFVQYIGYEYRLLHYYENNGEHFSHFVKYAKDLPYIYGSHYLPHDGENEQLAAEKTIKQQAIDSFPSCRIVIVQKIPRKALAIDAARGIFDRCIFDKAGCADGITCLRRYAYKVDPVTEKTSSEPEHDTPWSHGADAFMAIGQSMIPFKKPVMKKKHSIYANQN